MRNPGRSGRCARLHVHPDSLELRNAMQTGQVFPGKFDRGLCGSKNAARSTDQSMIAMQRREFIKSGVAAWAFASGLLVSRAAPARPRPKIAAIFTELRFRSHAFNILENFFQPYLFNGKLVDPGVDVVAMYADQFPADDMARDVAKQLNVPMLPTLEGALCAGGDKL